MIAFDLKCARDHVFESWFPDSAAFDAQRRSGRVACPVCGERRVAKALMAPNLAKGATAIQAKRAVTAATVETLVRLREQVEQHCDPVGPRFAEEARKIHYGEVEKRNIYGQTSEDEARTLKDEGIEFCEIPWIQRPDG